MITDLSYCFNRKNFGSHIFLPIPLNQCQKPGMVVNIVDASSLERNLYLTVQFMEMGVPVCLALNMMDVAKTRGIKIDIDKLS